MRSNRFLPPAELLLVRAALTQAGLDSSIAFLWNKDPREGILAQVILDRAGAERAAVQRVLAGMRLPHRGGKESRRTQSTPLRLRADEAKALAAEAAERGLDVSRTVGQLALEARAGKSSGA